MIISSNMYFQILYTYVRMHLIVTEDFFKAHMYAHSKLQSAGYVGCHPYTLIIMCVNI